MLYMCHRVLLYCVTFGPQSPFLEILIPAVASLDIVIVMHTSSHNTVIVHNYVRWFYSEYECVCASSDIDFYVRADVQLVRLLTVALVMAGVLLSLIAT